MRDGLHLQVRPQLLNNAQARPVLHPLPLHSIPTLTRELCTVILHTEQLYVKGLALTNVTNPPLRCMCYLRGLEFTSATPIKADMIQALKEYVILLYFVHILCTYHQKIQRTRQLSRYPSTPLPTISPDALQALHLRQVSEVPQADSENTPGKDSGKSSKSRTAVLGSQTLAEYAKDRSNMVLPPWISAPPARAGHTDFGKLSADQWRVLCTVNLPITLIRLWGTEEVGSRWREMLDNFLDLVVAVEIASLLVISEDLISEYKQRIYRYLTTLQKLYKDAPVCPNQHNALHLPDHMRGFGPTPGFRIFGTERFNYTLQNVNTNYHFSTYGLPIQTILYLLIAIDLGEMESSMSLAICRASNFASFVKDSGVLPAVEKQIFEMALQDDRRGTRVNEVGIPDPTDISTTPQHPHATYAQSFLPHETHVALLHHLNSQGGQYVLSTSLSKLPNQTFLHPQAELIGELQIGGVRYTPSKRSLGASHAMITLNQGEEAAVPAQVRQIFRHSRFNNLAKHDDIFIAVSLLQPLDESNRQLDPYRTFKSFGSLYSTAYEERIIIVRPSQIVCHYARTWMDLSEQSAPCYHILPLSHVGFSLIHQHWCITDVSHDV